MRQLRLLTRTDDGDHLLVETDDGLERFTLPVDATLRVTVAAPRPGPIAAPQPGPVGALPTTPSSAPITGAPPVTDAHRSLGASELRGSAEPAQEIGPREIQVRVRAGESPEDVAAEHGMTLERVMRFAGPVIGERMRITDESRRARARRTGAEDTEPTVVQFGEAVDARFAAHGIDVSTISWDSRRRDDGAWLIAATWIGGDGEHGAEWSFDRGSRSVAPLDEAAADLLSDRPIRPVAPPPTVVAVPRLASGVIAFPPFPDAHTGPIARIEDVFDQEAPTDGPLDLPPRVPHAAPAVPHAVPATAAAELRIDAEPGPSDDAGLPMDAGLQFEEPPLPLVISDAVGRPTAAKGAAAKGTATLHTLGSRREETEVDKASRAHIPSWDDILLGVRRKQD